MNSINCRKRRRRRRRRRRRKRKVFIINVPGAMPPTSAWWPRDATKNTTFP
jgi:hypothetical protein